MTIWRSTMRNLRPSNGPKLPRIFSPKNATRSTKLVEMDRKRQTQNFDLVNPMFSNGFEPKMKPCIAIVASNGWVFRNLLETNLLQDLGLLGNVIFLLDRRIAQEGSALLKEKGVAYRIVEFAPSRILTWLKSILLYVEVYRNAPRYSENKFRGPAKRIFLALLKLFRRIGVLELLYKIYRTVIRKRLRSEAARLNLPDFDVFLSASPNAIQDNMIATHAQYSGVKVANLVLSWDNIYSKGYMASADFYVVWGEVMADDLKTVFDISASKIFALGAPHIGGLKPRGNPAPPRNTLLYSTAAAVHFPDEKELVAKLAQDFADGAFPEFESLIIRTHPAGPNDIYDDLASPDQGIFVDHPTSLGIREISRWVPAANELAHLGQQLAGVSVAVNMASTMSLDCLVHGIKVINITAALNGRDLSRHYRSEHYAKLIEANLVRLAGSYKQLVGEIQSTWKSADPLLTARVESFIRPTDETVIKSLRNHILDLAPERRSELDGNNPTQRGQYVR